MNSTAQFPDPAQLASFEVRELLDFAARGRVGVDRRWLKAILDRGESSVPELVTFGMEDRDGDVVDLEEDIVAMLRHIRTPDSVPFLMECVRRQPDDVEDDIVEALIEIGAPAVDGLLALYDEIGEESGSDIAFVLAQLGIRDGRILALLLDRLEYDAADGAFLLGVYADPAAKEPLEKLRAELDPGEDATVYREVQHALELLEGEGTQEAAEEQFDIWQAYPDKALPPVDVLTDPERLELLKSPAAEYRIEALESFRTSDELDPPVWRAILDVAKSDPETAVRAAAWRSLAGTLDAAPIRDAMLAVLRNADAPVEERVGVLVALAQGPENPEVTTAIRRYYDDPATRAGALEAMWRSLDRSFAPVFPKHLDDPDLEIRRNAIWGVGYAGLASEVGRLTRFFDDEELRADALFAYCLAMPGGISRGRVRGMFRKMDSLAGGLTQFEAELVRVALDQRLVMNGQEPVFAPEREESEEDAEAWAEASSTPAAAADEPSRAAKPGRNDPCPCGSGRKYKKCCGQ